MAKGFHTTEVLTTPDDHKLIYWSMDRGFTSTDPVSFYVDYARAGGPWIALNPTAPVVQNCIYMDTVKRTFDMQKNLYYRVRAVVDNTLLAVSVPAQAIGLLTKEDYLTAKEIIRINYLALKKRGGKQGFLLIRKEWGNPCPACADWDTQEASRGDCPVCFGTGIDGGYYPGIEYWVNSQPPSGRRRSVTAEGVGVADPQSRKVYGIAYPWINTYTLWVDARSNERFVIRGVDTMAEIGSKPILYGFLLNRLPETNPGMTVPIASATETFEDEQDACPSLVATPLTNAPPNTQDDIIKSDLASDDLGWRRGLKSEPW